ncbi:MAG TPA: hypothetical protein VM784_07650 [Actinomycetota bacterium]|jgi:hypothetical protein|nr:hypothetical protein [Actinomycetota bacterium]
MVRRMRSVPDLHVEWIEDEAIVLDTHSGELHYLNPPAALVYALIAESGYPNTLQALERHRADLYALHDALDELIEGMVDKGLLLDD